ncbi:MAG: redoxin domain-containing protein [Spartobacteria bacterium]|nr:redoxin domain-containing protein [Spartobacteria bacterium]
MKKVWLINALFLIWFGVSTSFAIDPMWLLGIGDKAPDINGLEWLKGKDPATATKDPDYIVYDLWASWCGPCQQTIPILEKMSTEYADKGVEFVGIAVLDAKKDTDAFLAQWAGKMTYPIAFDADGRVAEEYLKGAGLRGIPAVFLVRSRDNVIMWIGHPVALEPILNRVLEDDYDLKMERQRADIDAILMDAMAKKNWRKALKTLDKLEKIDPQQAISNRIWIYADMKNEEKCIENLKKLYTDYNDSLSVMERAGLPLMLAERFPDSQACADLALHEVKQSVDAEPENYQLLSGYFMLLMKLNLQDQAIEVMNQLAKLNWDNLDHLSEMAQLIISEDKANDTLLALSATYMDRAVDTDPDWMGYKYLKIQTDALNERTDTVHTSIEELLKMDDVSSKALNSAAWFLVEDERLNDAFVADGLLLAQKANELTKGENPVVIDTLAYATFKNGDIDEAIKLQEKALKLYPSDERLIQRLETYKKAKEHK